MPNFSGIWSPTQQFQAKGQGIWAAIPGAPTIGTATAGVNNCASVAFTAPACTGYPATITSYRAISTPGCFVQTGSSSPLVVSGLTNGSSYTFKVQATNLSGTGPLSAASNSITAALPTCAVYSTAGTYSWVAPTGVTSVAVIAVGAGGQNNGGGGALRYTNCISVTPGSSYTVVVGAGSSFTFSCTQNNGGSSSFASSVVAPGGRAGANGSAGGTGGTGTGGDGGNGGNYGSSPSYGYYNSGGATGGYSGKGGNGGTFPGSGGGSAAGTNGAGGAGGGGGSGMSGCSYSGGPGGSGTTGLYGAGASGAGGAYKPGAPGQAGNPGGCGSTPVYGIYPGIGGIGASAGAVRIVWAGGSRGTPSFPSTNVGP
jgi:trimeric autotransporter adhesin